MEPGVSDQGPAEHQRPGPPGAGAPIGLGQAPLSQQMLEVVVVRPTIGNGEPVDAGGIVENRRSAEPALGRTTARRGGAGPSMALVRTAPFPVGIARLLATASPVAMPEASATMEANNMW